jgi:ATP-dependent Lon protease
MDVDITPMTEAVNLRDELKAVGIEEILSQLDRELIGLKPVKTRIREIASLLLIERIRKRMGLASEAPTLHMSFTGNPGTGKTTVALRIGRAIYRPHRAEDQGDPEEGDGRRAVHRRGLLSAPAGQ